jgi:hypothetical protein
MLRAARVRDSKGTDPATIHEHFFEHYTLLKTLSRMYASVITSEAVLSADCGKTPVRDSTGDAPEIHLLPEPIPTTNWGIGRPDLAE